MIFDTNVLIYLSNYTLSPDIVFLNKTEASISIITKIEALGFNFPNKAEHQLLLALCNELNIVPVTDEIAEPTIRIRKANRVKLPDAIIYATALTTGLPLLTNDIDDFKNLGNEVKLIDPFTL